MNSRDIDIVTLRKIDRQVGWETLANNITKLQGVQGYRLRVGNYRVIFDENDTIIDILRIRPRGDSY